MNYFTKGSGPHRTILLHGFLGSGRNLSSFATQWAQQDPTRTILVCDLLGHGESPPLPPNPDLYSLVPPILALIDAHTGPVSVVGHSMGGRAALVAAAERKSVHQVMLLDITPAPIADRNEGLEDVLAALVAAPDTASSRAEMRSALQAGGLSGPMADWLLMNLRTDATGLHWRFDRAALKTLGANTRHDNLWPHAEKVAHKLRCIYGTASGFIFPEDITRLEHLGADVRPIPGAGHYLHVDALPALLTAVK